MNKENENLNKAENSALNIADVITSTVKLHKYLIETLNKNF